MHLYCPTCSHTLALTPGALSAQQQRPLGAAAQGPRSRRQRRQDSAADGPGVQARGDDAKTADQPQAGLHTQKQLLLHDHAQVERCNSGIKAAWGRLSVAAEAEGLDAAECDLPNHAGQEQQPAALDAGSSAQQRNRSAARTPADSVCPAAAAAAAPPVAAGWQWKGLLTPRSCPATELAAEVAAAAGRGRLEQRSPGAAGDKKRRQPQAASPRPKAAAGRRLYGDGTSPVASPGAKTAAAATPGLAAAAAALFAAVAVAPGSPTAQPTSPSPAQLSPESLRYRHAQPLVVPAAQRAPTAGNDGQCSPDSQRFQLQAALTSVAVSHLRLQRLQSEGQQGLEAAAAGAAAVSAALGAEAAKEEEQPEEVWAEAGTQRLPQHDTPTSRYCPPPRCQPQPEQQAGAGMPGGSVVGSAAASPCPPPSGQQQQAAPGISAAVINARLAQAEQVRAVQPAAAPLLLRLAASACFIGGCATAMLGSRVHRGRQARAPLRSQAAPCRLAPPRLQLSPTSALRALRANLALLAEPSAAWAAQQHRVRGILERAESRMRWVLAQGGGVCVWGGGD